jgi:uncharacterized protein (TIGR04255 family)
MSDRKAPLYGPPPIEVPLLRAPLASVLWQIRFPFQGTLVAKPNEFAPEVVTAIQQELKSVYPIFQKQFGHTFEVSDGQSEVRENAGLWRFSSIDNNWHVSIARNFVSLQTHKYISRNDFVSRTGKVLAAIQKHLDPGAATRIGVRYVNRVGLDGLDICKMVRASAFGLFADRELQPAIQHSASEVLLTAEEGALMLRSLILPPNATHDPSVLASIPARSWAMDFDLYSEEPREFDLAALEQAISSYCKRIYAVFCWVVEDDFIEHFGGKR